CSRLRPGSVSASCARRRPPLASKRKNGIPKRDRSLATDAVLRSSVFLLLPEGADRALRERYPLRVPPADARRRKNSSGACAIVATQAHAGARRRRPYDRRG